MYVWKLFSATHLASKRKDSCYIISHVGMYLALIFFYLKFNFWGSFVILNKPWSVLPWGLDRDPCAEIGLLIGQLGADIGHGHGELEAGRCVKCRYKCQEHKYSRGDGHCYKEDVYSFGLCFSDTFLVKSGFQFAWSERGLVFKTSSDVNYSLSTTAALFFIYRSYLVSCDTVILKLYCVPTEKLTVPGTTYHPYECSYK